MSLHLKLINDEISLQKMTLPSRYYCFDDNYIKLLTLGEGFFPNDKLFTKVELTNSSLIIASESAAKVYPSKDVFAINKFDISLAQNSNLEFINDELIMFMGAKFIQFFNLDFDESCTFFCSEMMSSGRSYEEYDFSNLLMRNKFSKEGAVEYLECFDIEGAKLKDYSKRHGREEIFAKIYVKSNDNEMFASVLSDMGVRAYEYTQNRAFIVIIICAGKISHLKEEIYNIWELYRKALGKKKFDLGKR